jgi:hypothetical protein
VGRRKGAFVLTSDAERDRWELSGPHFAGWEVYHLKGSPADPNGIYAGAVASGKEPFLIVGAIAGGRE